MTDINAPIAQFKELVGHESDVAIMSTDDFDPRHDYDDVVEAVKSAAETAGRGGGAMTRVYHVQHGTTRAEYYVVALDKSQKRIIGVKAKAIES